MNDESVITKIKIVYNKTTGIIVPHTWNSNGTVSLGRLTKEHEPFEDIVVSFIDKDKVDFETNRVNIERHNGETKENNN